jgi:hypothetical protein
MDVVEDTTDNPNKEQQQSGNKSGRPPPIVLTSTTNLMQLQRHCHGQFSVPQRHERDFSAIKKILERNNLA